MRATHEVGNLGDCPHSGTRCAGFCRADRRDQRRQPAPGRRKRRPRGEENASASRTRPSFALGARGITRRPKRICCELTIQCPLHSGVENYMGNPGLHKSATPSPEPRTPPPGCPKALAPPAADRQPRVRRVADPRGSEFTSFEVTWGREHQLGDSAPGLDDWAPGLGPWGPAAARRGTRLSLRWHGIRAPDSGVTRSGSPYRDAIARPALLFVLRSADAGSGVAPVGGRRARWTMSQRSACCES